MVAAWLQATEGDLAASDFLDGLSNDHLAAASGQVLRLATYGFVCEDPFVLFMQLATLATVGAEAEALLGHGIFWAVFWLANLGGGLADAALSELPITGGPANGAAGMVGALAGYYVCNWGLQERIDAARKAASASKKEALNGRNTHDDAKTSLLSVGPDSLGDAEAEVEVLPLLLSLNLGARLTARARGLLNVLVALVVAGQGLLDLGDASSSASWIGLVTAFWTGAALTLGSGPKYEVSHNLSSPDNAITVWDVCLSLRRRLVLGGYTAVLGGLTALWLAWME